MSSTSLFSKLKTPSKVEVTEMCKQFFEDQNEKKVNLSIGGLCDENGSAYTFDIVRKVEKELISENLNHEYMPPLGLSKTNDLVFQLLFGKERPQSGFIVQSIGGTGPLRVGAEFLRNYLGFERAYYSNPTWINHRDIFLNAGFSSVKPYSYWNNSSFDFDAMTSSLKEVPEGSVIILHACAHNPTGIDPNEEQWMSICQLMKARNLFPFFDCAYQGFATGDMAKDAFPIRLFYEKNMEFFVSQSFGKNMGLAGERIGFLSGICQDSDAIPRLLSTLINVIRPLYSNPACHGSRILHKILSTPFHYEEWTQELKAAFYKLQYIRNYMYEALNKGLPSRDWSGLKKQTGMFYYSEITKEEGFALRDKFSIYILPSCGRFNLGGISLKNVDYVIESLIHVLSS